MTDDITQLPHAFYIDGYEADQRITIYPAVGPDGVWMLRFRAEQGNPWERVTVSIPPDWIGHLIDALGQIQTYIEQRPGRNAQPGDLAAEVRRLVHETLVEILGESQSERPHSYPPNTREPST